MKNINFILFALYVVNINNLSATPSMRDLPDSHFKIYPANSTIFNPLRPAQTFESSTPEECRESIEAKVCLVEPQTEPLDEPRVCLKESDISYGVRALEKIYDVYPPVLQQVFCSLDVIYIERSFMGTAYAGTSEDGKSAFMGIRESALIPVKGEPPLSMSQWISWKEQLSFGGDKEGYKSREDLVRVEVSMNTQGANDFLYFVIAHEFGHIIDFSNNVNVFNCNSVSEEEEICQPASDSWSEFSWAGMLPDYPYPPPPSDPWGLLRFALRPIAQFDHREQLCFYGCAEDHGNPSLMSELYSSLQASNFLTSYAATNPWDDFAESVAFYAAIKETDMQYTVVLPDETRYDLAEKYEVSPDFKAKREWLDTFFSQAIEYPHR